MKGYVYQIFHRNVKEYFMPGRSQRLSYGKEKWVIRKKLVYPPSQKSILKYVGVDECERYILIFIGMLRRIPPRK